MAICNGHEVAYILPGVQMSAPCKTMTEYGAVSAREDQRQAFLNACHDPRSARRFLKPHVEALSRQVADLRTRWAALGEAARPYSVPVLENPDRLIVREMDLSALSGIGNPAGVSLDVFDTCLNRLIATPRDVFVLLGDTVRERTGMEAESFASFRVETENALRERGLREGSREDTSLDEIYQEMACQLNWTDETRGIILLKELELEQLLLRPVPEVLQHVRDWQAAGIPLAYTSEMYLPSTALRSLLEGAGFPVDGIPVFTSGETGKSKGTGNLYAGVEQALGTTDIVHVGDNPVTDGEIPRTRGIRSLVIKTRRSVYEDRFSNFLHAVSTEPGRTARAGFWERFGFTVAGPLHVAFAVYLYKLCRDLGKDRIHFLSRDGWFPRRVFNKLQSAWGQVASEHYLYASREFLGLGSMTDIGHEDWEFVLKASPLLRVRDVFERIGISAGDYIPACRNHGLGDPKRLLCHHRGYLDPRDRDRLYHAICQCLGPFHDLRLRLAGQLRAYLEDSGIYAGRSLFVDVGWAGSSFRALRKLAPRESEVDGAYFALVGDAPHGTHAFFTSAGKARRVELLCGSIALMEFLFGSPDPSIQTMEKGGDGWHPVFREPLQEYDLAAWAEMEKGILAFTDRMLEFVRFPPLGDGTAFIEDLLKELIFEPGVDELKHMGPLSHGEGWGTRHRLRLLPAFKSRPPEPVLHEAYGYCPWKPGLKRMLDLGLV